MKLIWNWTIAFMVFPLVVTAQNEDINPTAVALLDHMSDIIGELKSCSFNLETSVDLVDPDYGLIKQFKKHEIHMSAPGQMLVRTWGPEGLVGYWYNHDSVTFYSFRDNRVGTIPAPEDDIIGTMDSIYNTYNIEFPAADFFYPTFTDDILDNFPTIAFMGTTVIGGKTCVHILANNDKMNVQLWLSNDATKLPVKFNIIYKDHDPATQYEATFNNWKMNPDLPPSLFRFVPPADAQYLQLVPKP